MWNFTNILLHSKGIIWLNWDAEDKDGRNDN